MKGRAVSGIAACAAAIAAAVACACAKAPEARGNGNPESNVEPSAHGSSALSDVGDASGDAGARFPGLPMPQKFPHVVWDAAGAPRDGAAR